MKIDDKWLESTVKFHVAQCVKVRLMEDPLVHTSRTAGWFITSEE